MKHHRRAKLWLQWVTAGPISKKNERLRYIVNLYWRFFNPNQYLDTTQTLAAMGYAVNDTVSFYAGYGYYSNIKDKTGILSPENKILEDMDLLFLNKNNVKITNRSRLEERFFRDQPEMNWRLRERIECRFLNVVFHRYTLILSNEFFFNLNTPDPASPNFYEQNRFIAAVEIPYQKSVNFDIGYMNRTLFRQPVNVMEHYVYLRMNVLSAL